MTHHALLPSVAIRDIPAIEPAAEIDFLARRLPERAWSQNTSLLQALRTDVPQSDRSVK